MGAFILAKCECCCHETQPCVQGAGITRKGSHCDAFAFIRIRLPFESGFISVCMESWPAFISEQQGNHRLPFPFHVCSHCPSWAGRERNGDFPTVDENSIPVKSSLKEPSILIARPSFSKRSPGLLWRLGLESLEEKLGLSPPPQRIQ